MRPARARDRRVLMVVTFDPWPVRSGITRRLDALVRALDEACDLRLLVCDVTPGSATPPLRGTVVRVPRDPSRVRSVLEVLRGAPRLRPLTAAFYVRPALRRAVAGQVEDVDPELVVTHGIGGAELVRGLVPASRVVLDADTIDPQTYRRLARDVRGLRSVQWAVDAALLPGWHQRRLSSYRAVSVVSQEDVHRYATIAPGARLVLVPNGVSLPSEHGAGAADGPALFVGPLSYPPNRSAVAWIVDELLPRAPDLRLRVVGEGTPPAHDRVEQAGLVRDLAPEWCAACALLVPLRSGGGTRLKVLEALAHGLPVLSTRLGVEGLGAVAGVHYLEADTVEEFTAQLERLRRDEILRARLSAAGRELAGKFAWAGCTAPLVEVVTGG